MQRKYALMIHNCHDLATTRDIWKVRLFPAHALQPYGRNDVCMYVCHQFLNTGTGYRWVVMFMPWLLASQFPALPWYCADHAQLSHAVSSSEVDCCHAVWHETLLQSFSIFYAFRKSLYIIKMVLCLLVLFCVLISGMVLVLGTK